MKDELFIKMYTRQLDSARKRAQRIEIIMLDMSKQAEYLTGRKDVDISRSMVVDVLYEAQDASTDALVDKIEIFLSVDEGVQGVVDFYVLHLDRDFDDDKKYEGLFKDGRDVINYLLKA